MSSNSFDKNYSPIEKSVLEQISNNKNKLYYLIWLYDTLRSLQCGFSGKKIKLPINKDRLGMFILDATEGKSRPIMLNNLQKCEECYNEILKSLIEICLIPESAQLEELSSLISEWQKEEVDHQLIIELLGISAYKLRTDLYDKDSLVPEENTDDTDILILYMFYYQYMEFLTKRGFGDEINEIEFLRISLKKELEKNLVTPVKSEEPEEENEEKTDSDDISEMPLIEWGPVTVLAFLFILFAGIILNFDKPGVIKKRKTEIIKKEKIPEPVYIYPERPETEEIQLIKKTEEIKIRKKFSREDFLKPVNSPVPHGVVPEFPQKVFPKDNFWITYSGFKLKSALVVNEKLKSYYRRFHGNLPRKLENKTRDYLIDNYPEIKYSPEVSWSVVDMQSGNMVGWQINKGFEGASVVKVWPMASLFDKEDGWPTPEEMAEIIPMIAVSSNSAWSNVIYFNSGAENDETIKQKSKAMRGYYRIQRFLKRNNYDQTKGGRISIGAGNSLINTRDLGKYFYDLNHNRLKGSEAQLKIMTICRTAGRKGYRYIPSSIYGGGKTGTYSYLAHDIRFYEIDGKRFGISVLTRVTKNPGYTDSPMGTNNFRNETVALLHGGLLREYITGKLPQFKPDKTESRQVYSGNYSGKINRNIMSPEL